MVFYLLISALVILQLLDWYSTRTILRSGGVEQNPVAKRLMEVLSVDGFLAVKAAGVALGGWYIGQDYPWVLGVLAVFYIYVVLHNWKSLKCPNER